MTNKKLFATSNLGGSTLLSLLAHGSFMNSGMVMMYASCINSMCSSMLFYVERVSFFFFFNPRADG